MRRGMVRGIVTGCFLAIPLFVFATGTLAIFVNDAPLALDAPVLLEETVLLVPLVEFARAVGVQVTEGEDEFVLRWSNAWRNVDAERFPVRDGVHYVGVEWLVGLIGGESHRIGDSIHIGVPRPALRDIEASDDRIVLRFTGFVPETVTATDGSEEWRLRLHNCASTIPPQLIVLGEGSFRSVRVPASGEGWVDVSIVRSPEQALRIERLETAEAYSVILEAGDRSEEETIVAFSDDVTVHRVCGGDAGASSVDYVHIEGWRARYRLSPALPSFELDEGDSLVDIAVSRGAAVAIAVSCAVGPPMAGPLVIGGVPVRIEDGVHDLFAVDVFGRWELCAGTASVVARHAGTRIPIDDVNRPLAYGEAIAYPAGYVGTLVRGIPGSFTVIKVRDDRVVSIYEGPFVSGDASATMIVASGEARARLAAVRLGDPIALECVWGGTDRTVEHAFAAGPALIVAGVDVDAASSSAPGGASCCSVLAVDWYGGMYIASLTASSGLDGIEANLVDEAVAFLRTLPTPVRDAVVIGWCADGALVLRDDSSMMRLGPDRATTLALCLVPLAP